ncbi:hypothetical protein CTAYLR_007416 [Chrysophaeum taylorii]|uniref:Rieske domain-containing protein n=1 Tax=Chrysophaeum taylorii TaxID=2483200 RepID=A0AAD7U4K2_9STRA|nr:hypothetical protein CTAYLR_007416 [Chrysophaeum taylorii]
MRWVLVVGSGLSLAPLSKGPQLPRRQVRCSSVVEAVDVVDFETTTTESVSKSRQGWVGVLADRVFSSVFGVLHFGDDSGVEEASKNLRVLWARALLDASGEISDPIAKTLLPPMTRGVVGWGCWQPFVKFAEFVTTRTRFIDARVEAFLEANPGGSVVVLGAGFDTRSERYAGRFIEVDEPRVVAGKQRLLEKRLGGASAEFLPCDLDDERFRDTLREKQLEDKPVLFVVEAVLFYVRDVGRVIDTITEYPRASLALVDSLKPSLASPFEHDARRFFAKRRDWKLVDYASRWGGAVHFVYAVGPEVESSPAATTTTAAAAPAVGKGVSYFPITSRGASAAFRSQSFDNVWYAVGFSWQIGEEGGDNEDGSVPFATRLWGEPLVLFRDAEGKLVCLADKCPHRAAPLSMGRVRDGAISCFYHGWAFGTDGHRVDGLPACAATSYPVEEREGVVYAWRGPAPADPSLLPERVAKVGMTETYHVDTVLDYKVAYEYIVENNLDSLHLFHLHDGSIPPIASLGMTRTNAQKLSTVAFRDDVGVGHVGRLRGAARPNKLIRFDAPNVVRHGGVSGFHESFDICPISPKRTRVFLRQYLPKGPILTSLLSIPGFEPALKALVNNWNYHIALEDYSVMVGQATTIDDRGAKRLERLGPGDDLIARFYAWRDEALTKGDPYFHNWAGGDGVPPPGPKADEDEDASAAYFGLRETFHANTPVTFYPPANPTKYLPLWNAHTFILTLLGQQPYAHTSPPFEKRKPPRSPSIIEPLPVK